MNTLILTFVVLVALAAHAVPTVAEEVKANNETAPPAQVRTKNKE